MFLGKRHDQGDVVNCAHIAHAAPPLRRELAPLFTLRTDCHPEDINGATCSYDDAIPAVGSFGRVDVAMGWPEDADHMCSVSRF